MLTPEGYYQKLRQLPPLMLKICGSNEIIDAAISLESRHHLTPEQSRAMTEMQISLIGQEYGPADVASHVTSDLKLSGQAAKDFTIDFLGSLVLPIQWFVGNVEQIIHQLGGDPAPYIDRAKKEFPEAFGLPPKPQPIDEGDEIGQVAEDSDSLLNDFEDRLTSFAGKAEVLLRLTGLSAKLEAARDTGKVKALDCEQHLMTLDSISSAINTHDLNPFEIAALKRKLKRVVESVTDAIG